MPNRIRSCAEPIFLVRFKSSALERFLVRLKNAVLNSTRSVDSTRFGDEVNGNMDIESVYKDVSRIKNVFKTVRHGRSKTVRLEIRFKNLDKRHIRRFPPSGVAR